MSTFWALALSQTTNRCCTLNRHVAVLPFPPHTQHLDAPCFSGCPYSILHGVKRNLTQSPAFPRSTATAAVDSCVFASIWFWWHTGTSTSTQEPPGSSTGSWTYTLLFKEFLSTPCASTETRTYFHSCPVMFCSQLFPVGRDAFATHMRSKLSCFNPFGPRVLLLSGEKRTCNSSIANPGNKLNKNMRAARNTLVIHRG